MSPTQTCLAVLLVTGIAAPLLGLLLQRVSNGWDSIGGGPLAIERVQPSIEDTEMPAAGDPELRREVRQLVVATDERRRRQGLERLDIEAETDRRLADFVGSG